VLYLRQPCQSVRTRSVPVSTFIVECECCSFLVRQWPWELGLFEGERSQLEPTKARQSLSKCRRPRKVASPSRLWKGPAGGVGVRNAWISCV
jgi:hypothetical protein